MKLVQYLEVNRLTLSQFARQCGTSASTILRIKDAEVAPSKRVAKAIWVATDGLVTPNDLFGLHPAAKKGCCMNDLPEIRETENGCHCVRRNE